MNDFQSLLLKPTDLLVGGRLVQYSDNEAKYCGKFLLFFHG